MISHAAFRRRGAALLIALATLAVCLTAIVAITGLAASTKLTRNLDHATMIADDLLLAAKEPILHWLHHESFSVVLPEDAISPQVTVMHDLWQVDGVEHELRITAWDQCGMAPAGLLRSGSPLRLTVPDHVLRILDIVDVNKEQLGLDTFASALDAATSERVFPRAGHSVAESFGDGETSPQLIADGALPALGAFIATHQQGYVPAARINVNTAPMPLVRAALREAGRGGYEHIATARASGKPVNVGSLPVEADVPDRSVTIVSSSNVWAFRIDIRVGSLHRSWWCVYEIGSGGRGQMRGHDSGGWVQRLVITH